VRGERRKQQDVEAHTLHSEQIQHSPVRMTIYRLWYLSGSRQWYPQGANRMSSAEERESDLDGLRGIRSIRPLE